MDWIAELKRCVQALAQPASVQLGLIPSFAVVGDELVLEFDDALRGFRAEDHPATPAQRDALQQLEALIDHLSGPQNEAFWLDASQLAVDPRWEEIRSLAKSVRAAFDWPDEVPAPDGAIYVNASGAVRNT
jgi:hypothetical protein